MNTIAAFPRRLRLSHRHGTTPLTSFLVTLLLWMLATGAGAQPAAKPLAADTAPAAQPAGSPNPVPTSAQIDSTSADKDLKFVVALFRHGVRSPLQKFGESAGKHAGDPWPKREDWGAINDQWGYLTQHGFDAVVVLGSWYGSHYSNIWGLGFTAYLWADVDERTLQTAAALATGLGNSRVKVTVGPPNPTPTPKATPAPQTADPLFHPFSANCGTPSPAEITRIIKEIGENCPKGLSLYKGQLKDLDTVLACQNECGNKTCEPLRCLEKTACSPAPAPSSTPRPSSPIKWDGEFSYASSATEAFLLEYANKMDPGWSRVEVGQAGSRPKLSDLLRLHEFYFDNTERDPYLAGIGGANLVREIFLQLNRKAGNPLPDKVCPHGDVTDQFVGLVGHDTNLANLNRLLKVSWKFNNTDLPDDTRNLPDNDALPAGALVFELRGDNPNYRVRIQYVAQSLSEIRNAPQPGEPYRIETTCNGKSPCEMRLDDFNTIAKGVIATNGPFLSTCQGTRQTCP